MAAYINKNMINNNLNTHSDSSDIEHLFTKKQNGGISISKEKEIHKPTGGFPPIFITQREIETPLLNNKKRQFVKPANILSIKQILESDLQY
jgi:hypothetical protein